MMPSGPMSDREWFASRPHRQHRVRLASIDEINEAMCLSPNRDGLFRYHPPFHVAVCQISPGIRIRSLVKFHKDLTGCPESVARAVWLEVGVTA